MSSAGMKRSAVELAAVVGSVLTLTACGSSSTTNSTSSSTGAAASGASSGSTDVAAARKAIASYIGKPSPFPVTDKLQKVPTGASIATVDSGTPVSSLLNQILGAAAKTMGVKKQRFAAGQAATTTSAAFDSVIAKKPDAVLANGINIELWAKQLKTLQAAKVPVVGSAVLDGKKYGLDVTQASENESQRSGKIMADYVVAKMNPKAKVVVYDVPEIQLIGLIANAFTGELKRICPACSVRRVQVPAATIANKAPSTIVSDLQAHSDTNVAVFADDEVQIGLPDALKKAGIKIPTLGFAPTPTNLQYLKDGKETAALASDLPVLAWTQLDQVAREVTGQKLSGPEAQGLGVVQFLTRKDITFNPKMGWTGYPDFAARFKKLWGV